MFQLSAVLVLNIGLMAYYDLLLAAVVCGAVLVVYASTTFLTARIAALMSKSFAVTARINRLLLATLRSETIVHMLDAHRWFVGRFSRLVYEQRYPVDRQRMNLHAVYTSLYLFLSVLLPIGVVALGATLPRAHPISVGSLLAFYALTSQLQEPLQNIPDLLAKRRSAMTLADRLVELMGDPRPPDSADDARLVPFHDLRVDVEHFSYDPTSRPLLGDVHLYVAAGDLVVITGTSGAGKSTLVKIMCGLLRAELASVTYNGVASTRLTDEARWKHILLVDQDPLLVEGTLLDNLVFGDEYSDDEAIEALRVVCLDEFANPQGLAEPLGGEADKVSGGQKQRIAIARMLLRHPDVLVLDEPTSALDADTASRLAGRLSAHARAYHLSLVVVSHKPDFNALATQIVEIRR